MPAYNCELYVKQAIESVLSQEENSFELLIADDCSTDKTKSIIDSFKDPRIITYHNTVNQGYLKASNLLLKKAKGEFIVFQDADDLASPNRFKVLTEYLKNNPEISAVGSNVITIDENGNEVSTFDFPLNHEKIIEHFSNYRTPIVGSALMFRQEILKRIGYYNEYFDRIGWEDFYWYSLIVLKYKVANVSERLYYYRQNMNSVSNQNRSFRSVAGFDVIVYYMKERMNGRQDDIQLKRFNKVDEMMVRFYISDKISKHQKLSMIDILKISPDFFTGFKLWLFYLKNRSGGVNQSLNFS